MLTFLTTYFELGLIFCIIDAIISWFDYGPAFIYTFDNLLKTLLTWPLFLIGIIVAIIDYIRKYFEKRKNN